MAHSDLVMFKIQKGIPIPKIEAGTPLYPWEKMQVGDSIFSKNKGSALKAAAYAYNKTAKEQNLPHKLTARHIKGGVRVWKISCKRK